MPQKSLWSEPSQELKPYLTRSLGLHALAAFAVLRLLPGAAPASNPVYTIDFVGPSAAIIGRSPEPTPAPAQALSPAAKPPPQAEFDEFGRRRRRGPFALPRPSLLRGWREKTREPEPPAAPAAAPAAAAAGATPGEAGISTDMPNFPYPWYISQVRAGLWSQWSARMPKQGGECVVVFSLLPGGGLVDLRIEVSSGDAAFDLTALGAVQDAAPFPPLPRGFKEPFLKIHVTLKSS